MGVERPRRYVRVIVIVISSRLPLGHINFFSADSYSLIRDFLCYIHGEILFVLLTSPRSTQSGHLSRRIDVVSTSDALGRSVVSQNKVVFC